MRFRFLLPAIILLFSGICLAQNADIPAADSSSLDFKQWGLLAIQDGGRRKPVDTFARETLIKITGRSSYTSGAKTWQEVEGELRSAVTVYLFRWIADKQRATAKIEYTEGK